MNQCCLSCLDAVFCYCFELDGEMDDDGESLEEQDTSTFWTKREANKVNNTQTYTTVSQQETNDDNDLIDSKFDPDEDYVKKYEHLGWHNDKLVDIDVSLIGVDELALETERVLSSTEADKLTPREITTKLNQFSTCIRLTKDMEKRRSYIQRYEVHKFNWDEDNVQDKEKAELYLGGARDIRLKPKQRLHYYQIAIKFTNNYGAKQVLREEYRLYAQSLSPRTK